MRIENNCLKQVTDNDLTNGTITIPEGVTSIGNYAFNGCTGLTSLIIPEGVTSIGWIAFSDCTSLTSLIIPAGVTSIGWAAFKGCVGLTSLIIPKGVTSIGNRAFKGCAGLTNLIIPEGITSIGEWAFYACTGLTNLIIPEGVTSIEDWAFSRCESLTSLIIPAGVTSIGRGAFCACTSLTSFIIPEGVTSIEDWAFGNCTSLTSLIIPEGVTSIGDEAFSGCSNLKSIVIVASTAAEFQRIKALLPPGLQPLADHNGEQKFNRIVSDITALLKEHPAGINDMEEDGVVDNSLSQMNEFIEEAETHLEIIKLCPELYAKQKKEFDSLVVRIHVQQNDVRAGLEHYLENPALNEGALTRLAAALYGFSDMEQTEKHQAMLALFKAHHKIPEVATLLNKSVWYLLHQKEPSPEDGLETRGIRCVPLALMQECMIEATKDLEESNPLKRLCHHLPLLTQQEIQRLIGITPISEALAQNPELGSGTILSFESFYTPQPSERLLPEEDGRFLSTTLALIWVDKRAEQGTVVEQKAVGSLMQHFYPPVKSAVEPTDDISHAQNTHCFFSSHPQESSDAKDPAAPSLGGWIPEA